MTDQTTPTPAEVLRVLNEVDAHCPTVALHDKCCRLRVSDTSECVECWHAWAYAEVNKEVPHA